MRPKSLSVLYVDDDPAGIAALHRVLERVRPAVEARIQTDADAVRDDLERSAFDLVVLDLERAPRAGLDVLRAMREHGYAEAVIVVGADDDAGAAIEVIRAGADEFLARRGLTAETLSAAIHRARAHAAVRRDRDALAERIRRLEALTRSLAESSSQIAVQSRSDAMTGLLNRVTIEQVVGEQHVRALTTGVPYAVALLDVDRFKCLNDTAGHAAGDAALREVARVLRDSSRDADLVARYGGEEFLVLLPDTSARDARRCADRLVDAVREAGIEHPGLGLGQVVTASAGVAIGPGHDGWESVVADADAALYDAKSAGRDRVVLREPPRVGAA